MDITYVSAIFDSSGYAESARNNVAALHTVGVNVNVVPLTFENQKSDLGSLGGLLKGLVKKNAPGKIQIIHTTPTVFEGRINPAMYNIGYTTWESTKLPKDWVAMINRMDEVWVPCHQNAQCFKDSGVKIPIFVFPHCFNSKPVEDTGVSNIVLQNAQHEDYIFYSVFQWTERKNPIGLLKAYLTEFSSSDKVALVLKTYVQNPGNKEEKDYIKNTIKSVKSSLYLEKYPKILLITDLLSRQDIAAIHQQGDCFISLHRAEGFGVPIAEAMMAGKPVITTTFGGPQDFVDDTVGYTVPYQLTPVSGMPWATYTGDQCWAEPDLMKARSYMAEAFRNREEAAAKGLAGRTRMSNDYSWETIGQAMKLRLEEIRRSLDASS